jgi:hypothetical protein
VSNFAKVDDGFVSQILVVPEEYSHNGSFYLSSQLGLGGEWIKTPRDNSTEATIGGSYSKEEDAFIPPKPEGNKWELNDEYQWSLPVVEAPLISPAPPSR